MGLQMLLVDGVAKLFVWPQNIAFALITKSSGAIVIRAQKQS